METVEAGFVTMLMERLHKLECQLQDQTALRTEIQELRSRVRALELPLSATEDLLTFSDGLRLYPMESGTWMLQRQDPGRRQDLLLPLDKLHADVVVFTGPCTIRFVRGIGHEVRVGEQGEQVTVATMVAHLQRALEYLPGRGISQPHLYYRMRSRQTKIRPWGINCYRLML